MTQGTTKGVPIDTDATLAANSDSLVASQKATKTYADTTVASSVAAAVSDTALASSWDGVTSIAPSKNAVYDAIASQLASYKNLYTFAASHTAAKVAGTYSLSSGGQVAMPSGTGSLPPQAVFYLTAADYPTIGGLATKLRLTANVFVNDVAPTSSFVFGLHTVTRPASSGGTGLCIFTLGSAVSGSTVTVTTPAADSSTVAIGADFAIPADGWYALCFVSDATIAASSHVQMLGTLQMRNA